MLVIETNQLECPGFEGRRGIAGTVTIIPDLDIPEGPVTPVEFTDSITLPFDGPFPFCKAPTQRNPDPESATWSRSATRSIERSEPRPRPRRWSNRA